MTRSLEPLLDQEPQQEPPNSAVTQQIPCARPICHPGRVGDIQYPDIRYRTRTDRRTLDKSGASTLKVGY